MADIYDQLEDDGYEDMADRLWNDTTDDIIARLQSVLNDIAAFDSAVIYDFDEEIYADVGVQ